MHYQGQCYCGKMQFQIEGQLSHVLVSRDSLRSRRGSLLWLLPRAQFHLLPEQSKSLTMPQFCSNCGVYPYAQLQQQQAIPMLALDIHCLKQPKLEQLRLSNLLGPLPHL